MASATLPPGFDGLQYIASYPDLIQKLGADRFAGDWLEWDREAMRFTNNEAATRLVRRDYRDGWKVEGLG